MKKIRFRHERWSHDSERPKIDVVVWRKPNFIIFSLRWTVWAIYRQNFAQKNIKHLQRRTIFMIIVKVIVPCSYDKTWTSSSYCHKWIKTTGEKNQYWNNFAKSLPSPYNRFNDKRVLSVGKRKFPRHACHARWTKRWSDKLRNLKIGKKKIEKFSEVCFGKFEFSWRAFEWEIEVKHLIEKLRKFY